VDDDVLELELIADMLTRCGFNVARAADGAEALAQLANREFPVMIVDWQMPSIDGIALTERLRAEGRDEIYIVMLTARDSNFDYERGYLAGVDDYLAKKLPETELQARVHAAFKTVGLRRALKEARAEIAALKAGNPEA
jgi:DNA-binding response OmpR family regulator